MCRLLYVASQPQPCAEGSLLDIQLPSGPPHVVLLSLLHTLRELRDQYSGLMVPPTVAKVLLRLAVQVNEAAELLSSALTGANVWLHACVHCDCSATHCW